MTIHRSVLYFYQVIMLRVLKNVLRFSPSILFTETENTLSSLFQGPWISLKSSCIAFENPCILFLFFLGNSLGERFSPLNYAAMIGENVRLNCSKQSDDTGYWFRSAPLSVDEILIYHKKTIRNGLFSVDESVPGRSDLFFTLSQETSGRYGCDSVDTTHTAQVIMTGRCLYFHFYVAMLLSRPIQKWYLDCHRLSG